MRKIWISIIAFILLFTALARADRHTVELRLIVDRGGVEAPTRDGGHERLGPPLVAPLAIARVSVAGTEVKLALAPSSARDVERATAANVNHRVAIVVDGTVQCAPVLKEAIRGAAVSITLRSPDDARALAHALER